MKKIYIALSVVSLLFVGCSDDKSTHDAKDKTKSEVKKLTKSATPVDLYGTNSKSPYQTKMPEGADLQANAPHIAKVLETIDAAGYTYAKVNEDGTVYWMAAPKASIKVGESISYIEQMVMKDFKSKALNRSFDNLMFASAIVPVGKHDHASHEGHAHAAVKVDSTTQAKPAQEVIEKISITKLAGGNTVEEMYTLKDKLKNKKIQIRAKVIKISRAIMGKDWIHLQDGSGSGKTSDIIATTKNAQVKLGDIVIVNGTLKADVDLGYGYFFSSIIQESVFSK